MMPTKNRLLVLLQILQEQSDDETWLTTADLRTALEREGYECTVRTLRSDVQSLLNCGYDIAVQETEGAYTRYAYMGRKLSMPDLQILVDAVSAARFIPQGRSEELVKELSSMAGPSHVQELRPQIMVSEHVKAKNKNMIYTVQEIRRAIDRNRKIRFRYLDYNYDKVQIRRHEGTEDEWYVVSPYATVWNDDRYYLVGWSDKRKRVCTYRIDRMEVPRQMQNKRVPVPEGFDVRDYTDKIFKMYGGPEERVTLRCDPEILNQVLDRFGTGVEIKPGRKHFTVTVPVSLSTTFYAWVFQYVGKMHIIAPEHVREMYAAHLEEALDDALGED